MLTIHQNNKRIKINYFERWRCFFWLSNPGSIEDTSENVWSLYAFLDFYEILHWLRNLSIKVKIILKRFLEQFQGYSAFA